MKRIPLLLLAFFPYLLLQAQPKIKDKKYPSLLWEITGNGIKKPSYLIGTMHVSSKLAFNLPDSFYIAIKNAQMVALETNPETWQEDMSQFNINTEVYGSAYNSYSSMPNDYLTINTLKFYKYDNKIQRSLVSNPSTINNLLYRSYGNASSDFEEDTYLDMYIFQCGKKWGKKTAGVENYGESMKLMAEAYKDAARDKSKKERSYGDNDDAYSADKLQEAYRSGNLDLLDSINKYNSFSAAFDEKFLYKRNEIQANSMDSIIKSGTTLFVGVGAAHLPGDRGVIEILRHRGYKLRPVKMKERTGSEKDMLDKIRVPVSFRTEIAEDGLFKVDIPGKFYRFGEDAALNQKEYADMANGSYYMVTRIMTNAWMWSHTIDNVYKVIDSLLYENIPGKIISKTPVTKNGYRGLDITNRTRRGDIQRYNIFITPFEILFFKMSGNGDYVKLGEEAKKFFGSIQLKEYKNISEPVAAVWKKYSPAYGGFSVDLPHEPYIGNDGSWIYDAEDKAAGTNYRVVKTDINNYRFVEEDTFDLSLMNESFMASEFIDSQLSRVQTSYKGYPAMDCKYRDKIGSIFLARFIIQGSHYYTLIARGKKETPAMAGFLNSFEIKPFVYNEAKQQKDTSLYFTVTTPVYPEDKKIKIDMPQTNYFGDGQEEEPADDLMEEGAYRNKTIGNDTTGEKIFISFYRSSRYYYSKDSTAFDKENKGTYMGDSTWVVKLSKKTVLADKTKVWEVILTDTGSSRTLWSKAFYKDGIVFSLTTQSDTLTQPSKFIKNFFETFTPSDTLKGINPFVKKSNLFFEDFMSKDSILHKRAVKHIDDVELDSSDLTQLKKTITGLNWSEKKYLDTKKSLINKLGDIKTNASATYLKDLYYAMDDTIQLQYSALESLLQHKTLYAYTIFSNIINTEPPVLDFDNVTDYTSSLYSSLNTKNYPGKNYDNGNFLDELSDSLQLTKAILPDLLPLLNLEDYKSSIMKLLGQMVDSNLVKPKDYELYFSKFLLEAKQELKKQSIAEKKKAIEKAEESKEEKKTSSNYSTKEEKDSGNDNLSLYATLLLPYWEKNAAVQTIIQQMLQSNDKQLKYNTLLLMLDNNKPYPDTLLKYFGSLDEYRYQLYTDLKGRGKQGKFPSLYNNHLDLGKSYLLARKLYDKPDSVMYVDRLKTEYKGEKGFVYFYKYKTKKDDLSWKLAYVGLVPENPRQFEFNDTIQNNSNPLRFERLSVSKYNRYDFTEFAETKINEDDPIDNQLKKELKKMIYSKRKSARQFYDQENDSDTETDYN